MTDSKKAKYEPPQVRSVSENQLFGSGTRASASSGSWWTWPYPQSTQWTYATGDWPALAGAPPYNPDGSRIPLCSVNEEEGRFVVTIEVPGVKPEEIDLTAMSVGVLVTAGPPEQSAGPRYSGTLTLPEIVSSESAEARFENGVLTVKLQKATQAKQSRIEIL